MEKTWKPYVIGATIITGVGVVGVCASKKMRKALRHQRELHTVKYFIRRHLTDSKILMSKLNQLSPKQVHFLYHLIEQFEQLKQGIKIEGESLRDNTNQILDEIQNFLMEH